jgi:hypothetical protein
MSNQPDRAPILGVLILFLIAWFISPMIWANEHNIDFWSGKPKIECGYAIPGTNGTAIVTDSMIYYTMPVRKSESVSRSEYCGNKVDCP